MSDEAGPSSSRHRAARPRRLVVRNQGLPTESTDPSRATSSRSRDRVTSDELEHKPVLGSKRRRDRSESGSNDQDRRGGGESSSGSGDTGSEYEYEAGAEDEEEDLEDEGDEEVVGALTEGQLRLKRWKKVCVERTKKGWESRRANVQIELNKDRPYLSEDYARYRDQLPDDGLLLAIRRYAAEFYTSRDLLHPPMPDRATTSHYESKKRSEIRREQESEAEEAERAAESERKRTSKGKSKEKEKNGRGYVEGDRYERLSREPKPRGKGFKYKRRDMRKALDLSVLLALGVLVEEHVKAQLEQVGFFHPDRMEEAELIDEGEDGYRGPGLDEDEMDSLEGGRADDDEVGSEGDDNEDEDDEEGNDSNDDMNDNLSGVLSDSS